MGNPDRPVPRLTAHCWVPSAPRPGSRLKPRGPPWEIPIGQKPQDTTPAFERDESRSARGASHIQTADHQRDGSASK